MLILSAAVILLSTFLYYVRMRELIERSKLAKSYLIVSHRYSKTGRLVFLINTPSGRYEFIHLEGGWHRMQPTDHNTRYEECSNQLHRYLVDEAKLLQNKDVMQ